jgi:hypothetical protein
MISRKQLVFDGIESFLSFGLVNDTYLFDKIIMQKG